MARPQQIDRQAIVAAALRVADSDGLTVVTMKRVAAELGVTPMALYHHVDGKDALLDGIVEAILTEVGIVDDRLDWHGRLDALLARLRIVAVQHPAAFPLLLQRSAITPAAVGVRDQLHHAIVDSHVEPSTVIVLERIISTLAIGFAAAEASGRFAGPGPTIDDQYRVLFRFVLAGLQAFADPSAEDSDR